MIGHSSLTANVEREGQEYQDELFPAVESAEQGLGLLAPTESPQQYIAD